MSHDANAGDVESLWGKINPKDFGSRFERERAPTQQADRRPSEPVNWSISAGKRTASQRAPSELEWQLYRPKTRETQHVYEMFLAFLQESSLKDQPRDILSNASDELLLVLKNPTKTDQEKHRLVEEVLGPFPSDKFNQLVILAGKLVDFVMPTEHQQQPESLEEQPAEIPIVFSENEDSEVSEEESSEEEPEKPSDEALDIDAINFSWLQALFASRLADPKSAQQTASRVLEILQLPVDQQQCENELVELLEFDKFDLIKMLLNHRFEIVNMVRLQQCATEQERILLESKLHQSQQGIDLLHRIKTTPALSDQSKQLKVLDIDKMAFAQGSHTLTNKKCRLPEKSFKLVRNGYEEIHVPAPLPAAPAPDERLIPINELPLQFQPCFVGTTHLNRVQSKVFPSVFNADENLLVCAPTGSGKTTVALLAVLRAVSNFTRLDAGIINKDSFKLVYVAPMKALVQEIVGTMRMKLSPLGLTVSELTGDSQLSQQDIHDSHLIVTTPEKWDVVTRKGDQRPFLSLVRLLIVDEVHLLHDERGPVLESLVIRTLCSQEQSQEHVRIVALSATLPNYQDVARFLRVNQETGVFFFPNSFRPCPMQQQFIGITEQKPLKRFHLSNEILYQKIIERAGRVQMIVFVHSRRETANIAGIMRQLCLERNTLGLLFPDGDVARREILRTESLNATNKALQENLPFAFAVHHAGLSRADRTLVEDLFADGHVQVLFSTATLAWGVNLPAHTVIIKGTQVFDPKQGKWTELSGQDVLQMLGRAGRPQFDKEGEGILITGHGELQYYLSLLNEQLPIESQLLSRLLDCLNAEVVLGTISTREQAVDWLGYSYLYVRMMREPALYQAERTEQDPLLRLHRANLVHSALSQLAERGLVHYDRRTGLVKWTELGRIASYFYLSHQTAHTFQQHLRPYMSESDLLRTFTLAQEFALVPVREEERPELAALYDQIPIPVRESQDDPSAKVSVLFQSHISRVRLEGFALGADLSYVGQNAARLFRALLELSLSNGWPRPALKALELAKQVQHQQWACMTPLRQFGPEFPSELARALERRDFPFQRMFELSQQELAELIRAPKQAHLLQEFLQRFPRVSVEASAVPLTPAILRIELNITCNVEQTELFWVLVQDTDGEQLLWHDQIRIARASPSRSLSLTVPLFEVPHPNYLVTVVSDKWLGSETTVPLRLDSMIVPEKFAPPTELLDTLPAVSGAFNPLESQVIHQLQQLDFTQPQSIFIGTSASNTLVDYLIGRFTPEHSGKIVYVSPSDLHFQQLASKWTNKFNYEAAVLSSADPALNLDQMLGNSKIILVTVQQMEEMTRRWRSKQRSFQQLSLLIFDDLHWLGSPLGPCYETLLTRIRLMRIAGVLGCSLSLFSYPLADYQDICEWLDCNVRFNFSPTALRPASVVKPIPAALTGAQDRMEWMCKMTAKELVKEQTLKMNDTASNSLYKTIVVLPDEQSLQIAAEQYLHLLADDSIMEATDEKEPLFPNDSLLQACVSQARFGYLEDEHAEQVTKLFIDGQLTFILVPLRSFHALPVDLCFEQVLLLGTDRYNQRDGCYSDCSLVDLLKVFSHAHQCSTLYCAKSRAPFYQHFLSNPVPIESHLHLFSGDWLLSEICSTRCVTNKQEAVEWFSHTFLAQRLGRNPSYYGIMDRFEPGTRSEFLSELVEQSLGQLAQEGQLNIPDDYSVEPLNLGLISSFYSLSTASTSMFNEQLAQGNALLKRRDVLQLICASSEFETTQVTATDVNHLAVLNKQVPFKFANPDFYDPLTKVSLLLQAHLYSIPTTINYKPILEVAFQVSLALVDLVASHGNLRGSLSCMEMAQSLMQGRITSESPLMQISHFTQGAVQRFQSDYNIESVYDLIEHAQRDAILLENFGVQNNTEILRFLRCYPNTTVSHSFNEGSLVVHVERIPFQGLQEWSTTPPLVNTPHGITRYEGWWIVIGNEQENRLLAIKKTTFSQQTSLQLAVDSEEDIKTLKLFVICDSYLGCDQEFEIGE